MNFLQGPTLKKLSDPVGTDALLFLQNSPPALRDAYKLVPSVGCIHLLNYCLLHCKLFHDEAHTLVLDETHLSQGRDRRRSTVMQQAQSFHRR